MSTGLGPILVALDGTARARGAVPGAASLAERLGTGLLLVEVVAPEAGGPGAARLAETELRVLARLARQRGVECARRVVAGAPVPELLGAARAADARLIWLACAGRPGLERWVLGSVADPLVQRAPVPVLIQTDRVPAEATMLGAGGPIVIPLDGSELAELALPEAIDLARALRRPVILVRANDPYAEHAGGWPANPYVVNAIDEATEGYLWSVAAWVRGQGVAAATASGWDHPAAFILDVARREGAPLIGMATRGRSGLGRFVLGRVADAVVRDASVPVVLVGPLAAEGRRSPLAQGAKDLIRSGG
jgi:nucleotide-binding universal stress UspA family protein